MTWKRGYVDRAELTCEAPKSCPLIDVGRAPSLGDMIVSRIEPIGYWRYDEIEKEVKFDLVAFTNRKCVDCIFAGGTKNKPDFWPNDKK